MRRPRGHARRLRRIKRAHDARKDRDTAPRAELVRCVRQSPDDARTVMFREAARYSIGPLAISCPLAPWRPVHLRRDEESLSVPIPYITRWGSA